MKSRKKDKQIKLEQPNLSPKTIDEVLKSADISPKNRFNKYAVAAIAKTTPCLKNWHPDEKK